ncbi:hypothetical protein THAOC_06715 [Thalassiosira oceanica]|uniref:Uncharacterized protein n=1 Tax=Thalassiosira oceanica TaxID=159749 RepID=K0T3X0_THAOC|nr:hypothetical protein THAOC_06715 [Thalassiosira oceanica]|eukprot:EJK71809.1 hypothetical protein THAOC_06715 [Thalassiosira oceanica]
MAISYPPPRAGVGVLAEHTPAARGELDGAPPEGYARRAVLPDRAVRSRPRPEEEEVPGPKHGGPLREHEVAVVNLPLVGVARRALAVHHVAVGGGVGHAGVVQDAGRVVAAQGADDGAVRPAGPVVLPPTLTRGRYRGTSPPEDDVGSRMWVTRSLFMAPALRLRPRSCAKNQPRSERCAGGQFRCATKQQFP